jgi:hypothetical protein
MNKKEVREALHIPNDRPAWDICSDEITTKYQKQYGDVAPFIKKILNAVSWMLAKITLFHFRTFEFFCITATQTWLVS